MNRVRRLAVPAALAVGALLFLAGVGRLFSIRFAGGDVFPPGSSRRADPRGTRAFLEALAELPGRRVDRNLEPIDRLRDAPETTLFLWGVPAADLTRGLEGSDWREVARFAAAGGRVVIGLAAGSDDDLTGGIRPAGATNGPPGFHLPEAWQFTLVPVVTPPGETFRAVPVDGLPERLAWPASPTFIAPAPTWETVYAGTNGPVVIRRSIGPGEVVMLASDYLVSNEALRTDRRPGLLAWLAGERPRVVFDETHLGLRLEPGLASLVRRYRLAGALAGLVLLAGLHVWRSVVPFHVQPAPPAPGTEVVPGRPSEEGLLHLLRRSLPAADLARTCLDTWREDPGITRRVPPDVLHRLQEVVRREEALRPRDRDPVGAYRELSRLLHPPRPPWKST